MGQRTRPALSRERILAAAHDVLMAEPGVGLTMRRLAEHLGVTPMALYKWFDNKDALLDALTTQLLGDAPARPASAIDAPWLDRSVGFAVHLRRRFLAYLPLLRVEGASQRLAASMFLAADEGLALMIEVGYDGQRAVDAYRVLFWSVLGHCLVIDAADAMPAAGPGGLAARLVELPDATVCEATPTLVAHLPLFGAVDPDEFFVQVVRTVLVGLRESR